MIAELINKIKRKWKKLRLQPIRVFCFHEIGTVSDGSNDWMPTDQLQKMLKQMQEEGYEFISLKKAHKHICNDFVRTQKYAVLTADDGLKCQLELLPWLEEHKIPITLCLNVTSPKQEKCGRPYRQWYHMEDEKTEKQFAKRLYISEKELEMLDANMVSYALHGYNHDESAVEITLDELQRDIEGCIERYGQDKHFVPFYVYKYGTHNADTDEVVRRNKLVPVLSDGLWNYNDGKLIHREILEYIYRTTCQ